MTGAVNRAAESAVSGISSVVSRLTGSGARETARLEGQAQDQGDDGSVELPSQPEPTPAPTRYVDYGEVAGTASSTADVADDANTQSQE